MLNISPDTLQNLRIKGTLPYRKIGETMFYKRADILKMIEGRSKCLILNEYLFSNCFEKIAEDRVLRPTHISLIMGMFITIMLITQ